MKYKNAMFSICCRIIGNYDDEILLGILMKYQLQGCCPDYNPIIPDKLKVIDYLSITEKLGYSLK